MKQCTRLVAVCLFILIIPSLVFAAKTHRVKRSESLYTLAKRYHVTVDELKSANNLASNQIKKGDLLVIPPRSVAPSSDETASTETSKNRYKVKKGETLTRIARKTGVSVAELKRLNGLKSVRVKPGKVIVLRGSEVEEQPKQKVAKKLSLRSSEIFTDSDREQSLAELADFDPDNRVDLSRNVELKVDNVKLLKKTAYSFLGARYRFGGNSRNNLDCSSFVQQVFREMEISLPRTAREQFWVGSEVPPGNLQRGDLVFFRTYASFPSHVGIYLGDSKMIHASSRDRRVVISTMNTTYYRSRFIGAKRIAKINPDIFSLNDLFSGVEEESADEAESNDTLGLSLNN